VTSGLIEPAPLGLYGAALRQAARGGGAVLHIVDQDGGLLHHIDPAQWVGESRSGDATLLARCDGATLDVGCGPGRLTSSLARAGLPVLGIDVSAEAVRQARRRGAAVLCRDVFGPVPREGRWRTVLLADGNIGIGGDPVALIGRCRRLLGGQGAVLVELAAPGDGSWYGKVRLRYAQRQSSAFAWAVVSANDITPVAERAGLRVAELWSAGGRWFARLAKYS
jgi:SAM-dependent methyltransferase